MTDRFTCNAKHVQYLLNILIQTPQSTELAYDIIIYQCQKLSDFLILAGYIVHTTTT